MPFPNTSDVNKLQKLQGLVQNFQDQKKSYALRKLGCNLGAKVCWQLTTRHFFRLGPDSLNPWVPGVTDKHPPKSLLVLLCCWKLFLKEDSNLHCMDVCGKKTSIFFVNWERNLNILENAFSQCTLNKDPLNLPELSWDSIAVSVLVDILVKFDKYRIRSNSWWWDEKAWLCDILSHTNITYCGLVWRENWRWKSWKYPRKRGR